MKKQIIFILLVLGILNFVFSKVAYNLNIDEIKVKFNFISTFLSKHNEQNFLLIYKFLISPKKYFKKIKSIENIFSYIEIFDRLAEESNIYRHLAFNNFIENNFQKKITKKRIEVILFLILNSEGYFTEILAENFQKIFSKKPILVLGVLSKEPKWKKIVDSLGSSDWEAFKKTVIQLNDNDFHGEFKKYVLSKNG